MTVLAITQHPVDLILAAIIAATLIIGGLGYWADSPRHCRCKSCRGIR